MFGKPTKGSSPEVNITHLIFLLGNPISCSWG